MKILFLVMGETRENFLKEGEKIYIDRLKHYCQLEYQILQSPATGKKPDPERIKVLEAELYLKHIQNGDWVVLLDEKGKSFSSVQWANTLQKWFNSAPRRIVFVVGGAFGFSAEMYARADYKLALSPLTFSHQMVRMIFLEQLYRAFTILRNESYHH